MTATNFFRAATLALAITIAGMPKSNSMAQSRSNDPLQPARDAKKKVQDAEAQVLQSLQEIERLSNERRPGDWQTEKLVIDEFRKKLIPALRKNASEFLTKKAEFDKNFKLYLAAVEKAPPAFQSASKLFEEYAEQEDDDLLKGHYIDMQQHALKWAKEMEVRHSRLDSIYKEVADKTKFVEKSLVFLDRLDGFLQIYPDPDNGDEVQKYLQNLNNYIEQFRKTIEAFKNFSKTIDDPKNLQSPGRQDSQPQPKVTSSEASRPRSVASAIPTTARQMPR